MMVLTGNTLFPSPRIDSLRMDISNKNGYNKCQDPHMTSYSTHFARDDFSKRKSKQQKSTHSSPGAGDKKCPHVCVKSWQSIPSENCLCICASQTCKIHCFFRLYKRFVIAHLLGVSYKGPYYGAIFHEPPHHPSLAGREEKVNAGIRKEFMVENVTVSREDP